MFRDTLIQSVLILAQDNGAAPANGGGEPALSMWPMLLGLGLLAYFLLIRPSSKERREHSQMLENLQKNDRVVTIGGIFGTVVEIKPDRVVLRVDDGSNTRLNVLRGSIARVVTEEKGNVKEEAK